MWRNRREWQAHQAAFQRITRAHSPSTFCLNDWAEANASGLTALPLEQAAEITVWAAGTHQKRLVEVMLRGNPRLHLTPNAAGDFPLHAAALCQSYDLFCWLHANSPQEAWQSTNPKGHEPIESLIRSPDLGPQSPWKRRWGQGNLAGIIHHVGVQTPALLRRPFSDGNTALHAAASLRHPRRVCEQLVAQGMKWNTPNDQGKTAGIVLAENAAFADYIKHPKRARYRRFYEEAVEAANVPLEGGWQRPKSAGTDEPGLMDRVRRAFKMR